MAKSKVERKRTEQIKIWATPEEKELIQKKMALYGTTNMGAFIRKMAIDGYVIRLTIPELKEMIRLLGIANNNINQIFLLFKGKQICNPLHKHDCMTGICMLTEKQDSSTPIDSLSWSLCVGKKKRTIVRVQRGVWVFQADMPVAHLQSTPDEPITFSENYLVHSP